MTGDEVYGADPGLRRELEDRATGYVLAVACSHQVTTAAGPQRADAIAGALPRRAWQRLSAGQGSKGPRYYDWAWITIGPGAAPAGRRSLLIRRNNSTGELVYYRCYAPAPVSLAVLVRVAGRRWSVEETSRPERDWPGSTSTRSAAGTPGTAGPPWPCSPAPSWPSSPLPSAPASHRPTA